MNIYRNCLSVLYKKFRLLRINCFFMYRFLILNNLHVILCKWYEDDFYILTYTCSNIVKKNNRKTRNQLLFLRRLDLATIVKFYYARWKLVYGLAQMKQYSVHYLINNNFKKASVCMILKCKGRPISMITNMYKYYFFKICVYIYSYKL